MSGCALFEVMSDPPIIVVFGARLAHGTDVTLSSRQALLRSAAGRRSEKTSADPVYDSASRYVGLFVLFLFCTVCYTYAACENIGIHRPQMHNGEVARAQLC